MRAWPAPRGDLTVHFFGDMHVDGGYSTPGRRDLITRELRYGPITDAPPAYRVCIGDFVDTPTGRPIAKTYFDGLTAIDGVPWTGVIGNHDLDGTTAPGVTRTIVCSALGLPEQVDIDLGFVRLLGVSPPGDQTSAGNFFPPFMGATELNWLDARLTQYAGQDCWILCHWPLFDTVRGPTTGPHAVADTVTDGTNGRWWIAGPNNTDDSEIRAMLAAHPNARAWFCGHTHNPIDCSGMVKAIPVGGRNIAHVNCSAVAFAGAPVGDTQPRGQFTPVRTPVVTKNGSVVEVRWFDFGQGCYVSPRAAKRVQSVNVVGFPEIAPAGAAVRLAADSLALADGAAVASWTDSTGNGRTPTQATAANQPTFWKDAVNGLPVVRFDGNDQLAFTTGLDLLNSKPGATIFAVAKPKTVATTARDLFFASSGSGVGPTRLDLTEGRTSGRYDAGGRRLDADGFQGVSGGDVDIQNFNVREAVYDFAGRNLILAINGLQVASSSAFQSGGNTSATNSQAMNIGNSQWLGDLAEIIIFDRALTAAERATVRAWLADKYALAGVS